MAFRLPERVKIKPFNKENTLWQLNKSYCNADLDLRGESFVQNTFEYLIDFLKSKNSVFDTSPLEQAIERSATRLGKKYPVQPLDE